MWISRLLTDRPSSTSNAANPITSLGPAKSSVARTALYNLLSTNPELADVFVDQCYDSSPSGVVSRVYFQVRCWYFGKSNVCWLCQRRANWITKE